MEAAFVRAAAVLLVLAASCVFVAVACSDPHHHHHHAASSALKASRAHSAAKNAKPVDVFYTYPLDAVSVDQNSVPGVNQQTTLKYLRALDVDRFLYFFRLRANLSTHGVQPYGGWESDKRFYGHFVGHYLSALAQLYAATGSADLAQKASALVAGFAESQAAYAASLPAQSGYFSTMEYAMFGDLQTFNNFNYPCAVGGYYDGGCVPFYTMHKYMNGLLDWAEQGEGDSVDVAADVLDKLSLFVGNFINQTVQQKTQWQWDSSMNIEFGGMNDVLYAASALAHGNATAEEKAKIFAAGDSFEKSCFLGPLAIQHELLDSLHSNTHIPQVIGYARRYEMTGSELHANAVKYFWRVVTETRSYATGGSSHNEHWYSTDLSTQLGTGDQETCVSYNMAKLTRMLLRWTGEPQYASYYHRIFYNGLLGTIDVSEPGRYLYYTPLSAGVKKNFGHAEDSFWCCYGTGIENWAKVGDSIFFTDKTGQKAVYVNLFFSSTLKVSGDIQLVQTSNYPNNNTITFTWRNISPSSTFAASLNVLIPWYLVSGGATLSYNGAAAKAIETTPVSYYAIAPPAAAWKNGDSVTVTLPLPVYAHYMPDNNNMFALMYGPLVLVGLTSTATLPVNPHTQPVANWLKLVSQPGQPLRFQTSAATGAITFMPLNEVVNEQYTTYFTSTAADAVEVATPAATSASSPSHQQPKPKKDHYRKMH